jgi:hypothetical protein
VLEALVEGHSPKGSPLQRASASRPCADTSSGSSRSST